MATINGQPYDVSFDSGSLNLTPKNTDCPTVSISGDGVVCAELQKAKVPQETLLFLNSLMSSSSNKLEVARVQTAKQLWSEYSDSWQEAGDTDVRDEASFARAIGSANYIELDVNEYGSPSGVSICWENTDLFLGHSIFTDIIDPEHWANFSATIFG